MKCLGDEKSISRVCPHYLAEEESPRLNKLWADVLMPEHFLRCSYGRPETCYLKGGHNPASTRQFRYVQIIWGSTITYAWFLRPMRIHDHPSVEDMGEGSRRRERLPIKLGKRHKRRGEKRGRGNSGILVLEFILTTAF